MSGGREIRSRSKVYLYWGWNARTRDFKAPSRSENSRAHSRNAALRDSCSREVNGSSLAVQTWIDPLNTSCFSRDGYFIDAETTILSAVQDAFMVSQTFGLGRRTPRYWRKVSRLEGQGLLGAELQTRAEIDSENTQREVVA